MGNILRIEYISILDLELEAEFYEFFWTLVPNLNHSGEIQDHVVVWGQFNCSTAVLDRFHIEVRWYKYLWAVFADSDALDLPFLTSEVTCTKIAQLICSIPNIWTYCRNPLRIMHWFLLTTHLKRILAALKKQSLDGEVLGNCLVVAPLEN